MELDVTAMGELLIDFAPRGENEMGYPVLEANPGGAPGNFLAALAAYGARTAMLGKVGDDAFGHLLRETMARAGIETTGIVMDPSVFTTLAFVTLSPEGDRSFSFARKPGADTCLTWEEVDRTLIDAARVFHFGTLSLTDEPSRTATRRAVAYARENPQLLEDLLQSGRLPLAKLCQGSGVERKTLERHRKYLVALLLIYTNGYEIIRGHLKQMQRGGARA